MKVVHLAQLYWPHVGGIEKHIELLASALKKKNCETVVVTKKYDVSLPSFERKGSTTIHRFDVSESSPFQHKLSVWKGIWNSRNVLFQADVIHVHDVFWWLLPLLPFLLLKNKKVFMTFHGYEGSEAPQWKQKFWHKSAEAWSNGNLCIGGFHTKYYGIQPTLVSFGAVESKIKQRAKSATKRTAIFIGRLQQDTGFLEYVETIKVLRDRGEVWQLDVYGEGSQLTQAQAFCEENALTKQAHFHGFVANADRFLPKYSVAFVSRYLALLEALSAGVPVVAQYTNNIKKDYLVLDSPFAEWISVARTPKQIADCVQEKRKGMSKAQKWADSQTWSKMADTYLTLWTQS